MTPYDIILNQLEKSVPFAKHTGVTLKSIADGLATAELAQRPETSNHIGTQHAGAMFTLGEAASGAAMAGALAPVILTSRPVAATAQVSYQKIAKGTLTATAKVDRAGSELMEELRSNGKVAFDVHVDITDANADTVAQMTVNWYVSPA